LDNIKIFLTALVVTHHTSCAFGGCGARSWFLIVGTDGPQTFTRGLRALAATDQAYFMALFFFISAYFSKSSYAKRGGATFLADKRRRLWVPMIFATLVLVPACIGLGYFIADRKMTTDIPYVPMPGHTWFLIWLLLLNWVYTSILEASKKNSGEEAAHLEHQESEGLVGPPPPREDESLTSPPLPFPSSFQRVLYGSSICGILMLCIVAISPGSFATMPQSVGSLTCDLFLFYMGLLAKQNGWLENGLSLTEQLDISPVFLAMLAVAEGAAMVFLVQLRGWDNIGFAVLLFSIAGVFCLDMSLLILIVFQSWMNFETRMSRFLSRAAYGVYVIHPAVVCSMTALYITLYNDYITNDDLL
jgi:hypothetical protein